MSRRAALPAGALALVVLLAVGAGVAWAAIAASTSNGPSTFTAAADLRAPTSDRRVVAPAVGGSPGTIRQGGDYYVYANVSDLGSPASGVSAASADLSSFDTGQTAVGLSAGSWSVGGQTYNRRSALLTADSPLTTGTSYGWGLTLTDAAGNARSETGYSVAVESYSQVITATSGLQSYWRLGEASGTTASATTGSVTGTYQNGPTLGQPGALAGDANTAVGFDLWDDKVNFGDNYSYGGTASYSVEVWIKRNSVDEAYYRRIIGKDWDTSGGRQGWDVMLTPNSSNVKFERFRDSAQRQVTGTTSLAAGVWYHVVATYDGASLRVYVNGALDGTASAPDSVLSTNAPLEIASGPGTTNWYYGGLVDEVAIYNQALPAATVLDHFKVGRGTG